MSISLYAFNIVYYTSFFFFNENLKWKVNKAFDIRWHNHIISEAESVMENSIQTCPYQNATNNILLQFDK